MPCGLCGAGKTTLTTAMIAQQPTLHRLSIDEIIASRHGLYGIDYPAEEYAIYQREADEVFHSYAEAMLAEGKDLVLDRSFYAKETRDHFRQLVVRHGGRVVLVYLEPPSRDDLWKRLQARREAGINANSAVEITHDMLDQFWDGFEVPEGEGEIVLRLSSPQ